MGTALHASRNAGAWSQFISNDRLILLLSILAQILLALLFGHLYDMRIFMSAGYLVGTGQNPYAPQDLSGVFNDSSFQGITTIGYPPPWPLLLGLIYKSSYSLFPGILFYNLAIKIPIILANIAVAYLVADIIKDHGADPAVARRAWIFLLLNPFLFYFSSAWGQFDSIVALLSLSALVLLHTGKLKSSAWLLALGISFKPIALPILPVALFYLLGKSLRQTIVYSVSFIAGVILFCVAPFILFGWDPTPIIQGWNAHFTVGGGMSLFSFFELWKDTYALPANWWLLGLAWIPALGIGILVMKPGMTGLVDLLKNSLALILIFFLTRTWLSEPNVVLILPFVVILTSIGELHGLFLAAVMIFPLAFTIFNTSPPQLLFPGFPVAMGKMLESVDAFRKARLLIRTAWVVPWQIAGWWMVIALFKNRPASQKMD